MSESAKLRGYHEECRSPETRAKISVAVKKALSDPEVKERVIGASVKARNTPEVKNKLKAAWSNPDKRKRRVETMKATAARPEVKQRMSEASKKHRSTSEARQRASETSKARWDNPETREHNTEAIREVTNSRAYRNKMSEIAKREWANPEFVKKMMESQQKRENNPYLKPSSLEMMLARALDQASIVYIQQYRPSNYWRYYDFYLPNDNLLIEVDGDYWHSLPSQKPIDAEKDLAAVVLGHDMLRVKEADLRSYGPDFIIQNWILRLNV